MIDFLTFRSFVTPAVIIFIYYIGAVVIPLLSWLLIRWGKNRYFPNVILEYRLYLYAAFAFCFFCMELLWRMMAEFVIAYFDMHDALMRLSL
ncbi:MAG: DUF4282 domain-containing protein [Campylobacterota bacterium]|nr:DUF4282 domain-containing protein [Campylobacterota bacterium]